MSARSAFACLAGVALLLSGCSAAASAGATTVEVSVDRCGTGWGHPGAGPQHLVLHNTDTRAGEVYLTDAGSGAVYAEVDPLGAGTTQTLDITLGRGAYAFRCAMEDEQTVTGPTVTITGGPRTSPSPVAAVAQADLLVATRAYQDYVSGRLPALGASVAALQADIARGDLAAARTDWLPAHLQYETLGAAYGAFGDLDGAINGLPSGLPQGVSDPGWTGFHRLEYGLWRGQDAATLRPVADALAASVARLQQTFEHDQIDPLTFALRAHEITENALQFELTGRTDFGSGSSLQTVGANLDGTVAVLGILKPLLGPRFSQLPATLALLERTREDAASLPPLASLSRAQRERIDAEVSQLAEDLAPVASMLEPRRANG
ncbi:EfeM/EfeO family lipoprotein [Microbacterium sp. ASV49]|uniref:EfeM/EfeO family lipoprotein n=1 Tax=Microbacterium candidum TaxID=3041922 RepID=A0ABT7MUK4_9MICO|nr:EfeM/EfeO family lipoprotein [Microbacterium sp. ASV49]MDL9978108.1 EfeM/EfeO family lipoprotein [Microbacterium sp. ASV49]